MRAGVSPAAFNPRGGITTPLLPPPPCIRKSPFHLSGMANAKVIPNSSPSTPVRRFITPSTRQYAGRGALRVWFQGIASVVPAAMAAALVISTFSALKFARFAQELDSCAQAQLVERNIKSIFRKNFECISPQSLNRSSSRVSGITEPPKWHPVWDAFPSIDNCIPSRSEGAQQLFRQHDLSFDLKIPAH